MPERELFHPQEEQSNVKKQRTPLKAALALGAVLLGGGALYEGARPKDTGVTPEEAKYLVFEAFPGQGDQDFLRDSVTNPDKTISERDLQEVLRTIKRADLKNKITRALVESLSRFSQSEIAAAATEKLQEKNELPGN